MFFMSILGVCRNKLVTSGYFWLLFVIGLWTSCLEKAIAPYIKKL